MQSFSVYKRNSRYLLIPHYSLLLHSNLLSLDKTLVSPCPIYTSHTPYSSISSTGSFSFCSQTYSSAYSLCLCNFHGCTRSLSSFSSHASASLSSMTYHFCHSSKCLGFNMCKGYTSERMNLNLFKSWSDVFFRLYSESSFDTSQYIKSSANGLRPLVTAKQDVIKLPQYRKSSTNGLGSGATAKDVSKIIQLLKGNEGGSESKLNLLNTRLSIGAVMQVFQVLNREKRSALQFFHWLSQWQPELGCNSDICSLAVDNCGHMNDYKTMRCLLYDFRVNKLSLNKNAFRFLSLMAEREDLLRKSTQRVIDILNDIGETCYSSGVRSLVEMLSILGSFNLAKLVIKKTEMRLSYYNILIREMCRRCDFKGAENLMDEMREAGSEPSAQTYNYVISNLLRNGKDADASKLFQEMKENDCPPDAITFEIFIYNSCHGGKFDIAFEFLDEMLKRGLQPRLSTHAAFIKGFFKSQQYEEAYKYVVDSDDKLSSSANYSLLAGLHQRRGDPIAAEKILSEMIKKGLRPNLKVYMRVSKNLQKLGMEKLSADLQKKFH